MPCFYPLLVIIQEPWFDNLLVFLFAQRRAVFIAHVFKEKGTAHMELFFAWLLRQVVMLWLWGTTRRLFLQSFGTRGQHVDEVGSQFEFWGLNWLDWGRNAVDLGKSFLFSRGGRSEGRGCMQRVLATQDLEFARRPPILAHKHLFRVKQTVTQTPVQESRLVLCGW